MWKKMGKVVSALIKPLMDFNIESRAHKAISKKHRPSIQHTKDLENTQQMLKDYPDAFRESLQKNPQLDKHLKDVYVTAQGVEPTFKPSGNLPTNKTGPNIYDAEFVEPDFVPVGKISLKKAIEFITNHQTDAINYPVSRIANETKLDEETIRLILRYCRVLEAYVADQKACEAIFFGPYIPRKIVKETDLKQLKDGA